MCLEMEVYATVEMWGPSKGGGCDYEWVKAAEAEFMPTLPNQSAPSAHFSPAKVTHCTVPHITAHSPAAFWEEIKN